MMASSWYGFNGWFAAMTNRKAWMWFGLVACGAAIQAARVDAQEPEQPTAQRAGVRALLPTAWHGVWAGTVTQTRADGSSMQFEMRLTIAPTDDPKALQWLIEYSGAAGSSRRDYRLIAGDGPNRFVIDEQNGIRLDATLFGDTLSSHFQVGGQTLWDTHRLVQQGDARRIEFELFTASQNRDSSSQATASPEIEVLSSQPSSRQFAVLQPVASATNVADGDFPTWRKLETQPYRGKQDDIFFIDENRGWYVNGEGKIYRTQDGGGTWQLQLHQPGTYFRCIAFVDEAHGFAGNIGPGYFPNVTDTHPLYETRDGGATWAPVTNIAGPAVTGLCALQVLREPFVNAGVLDTRIRLIGVGRVGGPAAMMISDDLGASWQSSSLSEYGAMAFDVHFFNRNEGVVAAASDADVAQSNALILTTADGGQSWQPAWRSPRPFELTWKISFPTRDVGYVTIQSYNPDPKAKERYVAKTVDGGKTWTELPLVSDPRVREFGVAFLSPQIGWVGAMPHGFQTLDGGKTWTQVDMGNAVNKIRLLQSGNGYVGYAIGLGVHRIDVPASAVR